MCHPNLSPLGFFEKPGVGFEDQQNANLAKIFFKATTMRSSDSEAILPQHFGPSSDLSVFGAFSNAFPEIVGPTGAGAQNRRKQSRRVPSQHGKQGQPGYGLSEVLDGVTRFVTKGTACIARPFYAGLLYVCVHAFGSTLTVLHFAVACRWGLSCHHALYQHLMRSRKNRENQSRRAALS